MSRRQAPPDFEQMLVRMQKGLKILDEKIKGAKSVKKLIEKALKDVEGTVNIANLNFNLFMIENILDNYEATRDELKNKALQVVGMIKLVAAQKKTQAKAQAEAKKKQQPN